jgi:hypothetical protein
LKDLNPACMADEEEENPTLIEGGHDEKRINGGDQIL